jgi:hypothetical protein
MVRTSFSYVLLISTFIANCKFSHSLADDVAEYVNVFAKERKVFNKDGPLKQFYANKDTLRAFTEMKLEIPTLLLESKS